MRIVLALAAIEDMKLRSVDISYAFTNSDIDVEIYMEEPDSFKTKQGGKKIVYRLNKSLYGLKQSSRLWGETLEKVLVKLGFKKTYSDALLYIFFLNASMLSTSWMNLIWLIASLLVPLCFWD